MHARPRSYRRRSRSTFHVAERLETRRLLAAPSTPVIIEPFVEGQITGTFDINIQTDPSLYSDPDGHALAATEWRIKDVASNQVVWHTGFLSSPPLALYRVDFSNGTFVNALAGRTELDYDRGYQLVVRYRDTNNEVSAEGVRGFRTTGATQPVPGAGDWLVRPGYVIEPVQSGLRLPVNLAFVPNPGPNLTDPLYYIAELYGSIQVVLRNGTRQTFATGLLDYNPTGPISGSGEQGMVGLAVERDAGNPAIYQLYVTMLWDNGAPPGGTNHYPKVERLTSTAGGLSLASRTVLLNMQPEVQGQAHQISNLSIGPDNKLYVHMGDGFDVGTGLNLDSYRGKILRLNKDGTAPTDNPFYNPANGINARDYIYAYGFRNPFGGAWRSANNSLWTVENGNSIDRLTDVVRGQSYGWAGSDAAIQTFSKYVWSPSIAPVNIAFVESQRFGGSGFPGDELGSAYATLSGSTYALGPQPVGKSIVQFPDLDTLNPQGKLAIPPVTLVKYNGTGRASVAGLAAGPDGLYFTDLYENTGAGGATAAGANVYRIRYVGNTGGAIPTVATPASASTNPIAIGSSTQLTVLGTDDGGESNLTYSWTVLGTPPAPVLFSVNSTNAAKNTTASFLANGTYNLAVVIRDAGGQAAISSVTVVVASFLSETGNGLTGTYYDNINFTGTSITRTDSTINFDWGLGQPHPGIGADTFSVRWSGFVVARTTGTYTFHATSDDGVRLWVNNLSTPIINAFFDQGPTTHTGTVTLNAGQPTPIRLDYYENGGGAVIRLEWSSAQQPREVVPRGVLFSALPTLPANPIGFTATAISTSRINLAWTDASGNEAGFRVERSSNGSPFTLAGVAPANATSFADLNLQPDTTYSYRLRAVNVTGSSAFVSNGTTTFIQPALLDASLDPNGPSVLFQFNTPIVEASVAPADLQITRLSDNVTTRNATGVTLSQGGTTLTFSLPNQLADGDYRFRIGTGDITSSQGVNLPADADLMGPGVFILAGDADRDRRVDFADLLVVAQNYGQSGRTFMQGNFDYSPDGLVGFSDLLIVAQRFGDTLLRDPAMPRSERRHRGILSEIGIA